MLIGTRVPKTHKNQFWLSLLFIPQLFSSNDEIDPAVAFILVRLPLDILKTNLFPMLNLSNQISIAHCLVNRSLFTDIIPANKLLHLLMTYKYKRIDELLYQKIKLITEDKHLQKDEYLQKVVKQKVFTITQHYDFSHRVDNPTELLVYAILKKYPNALTTVGYVTHGGVTFYGSPVKYICRSRNRLMKLIVSKLVHNGAKIIATEMAAIQKESVNHDVVLMPSLPLGKTPTDLRYNHFILLTEKDKFPDSIAEDAILLIKKGNLIKTYRMKNDLLRAYTQVNLRLLSQSSRVPDQSSTLSLSHCEEQKESHQSNINYTKLFQEKRQINLKYDPQLFEQLRLICDIPPPLPNNPALIKSYDEYGHVKITLWGCINGQYEFTQLTDELFLVTDDRYVERAYNFSGSNVSCLLSPPIRDGVVLKANISSDINAGIKNYRAHFVIENQWLRDLEGKEQFVDVDIASSELKQEPLNVIQKVKSKLKLPDHTKLLMNLEFPGSSSSSLILSSGHITCHIPDLYQLVKKGHSLCFDARQYTRAYHRVLRKFPQTERTYDQDPLMQRLNGYEITNDRSELYKEWCKEMTLPIRLIPLWIKINLSSEIRKDRGLKVYYKDDISQMEDISQNFERQDYENGFNEITFECKEEAIQDSYTKDIVDKNRLKF
jgi:hypothetical protein